MTTTNNKIPAWLEKKLKNRLWRLENLYWITNEAGQKVKFKLKKVQRKLLKAMHWRNIILKARQLGFTTFVCIFALDLILFNSNVRAGFVAHTREAAEDIFYNKVKFAYNNLPDEIKALHPTDKSDAGNLVVKHGDNDRSSIKVATSLRSGTYQLLHISELGKIGAESPKKEKEVKTGTLPTAHRNAFVFIESTAEGKHGMFYDYCIEAEANTASGKSLDNLEFKHHFFAWWEDDKNRADPNLVELSREDLIYFANLEKEDKIFLDAEQKAFWAITNKAQGDDMFQEFPSTASEPFNKPINGAYYAKKMAKARSEGRIGFVAYDEHFPVYTFWDIGINDCNVIWFAQFIAGEIQLIDYYECNDEPLKHYIKYVKEKEYIYEDHFAPHDMKVRSYSTGVTRWATAKSLGITFKVMKADSVADGIEAVRGIINICRFDKEKCERGIVCLENYRKEWNEQMGCWRDRPRHDWASHGSDGFRGLAMMYRYGKISGKFHNPHLAKAEKRAQRRNDNFDPLTYGLD